MTVSQLKDSQLKNGQAFLKNDGSVTPIANLPMGGFLITNLGNPSSSTDAANKSYVDSVVQGLDVKISCRAIATTNIASLSGPQTIDAVSLIAGDRVLLTAQTAGADNGIWVVGAGAWLRATDADTSAKVTSGMYTWITEGTYADTGWLLITPDPIILNTTTLTFTQFSGAGQIIAGAGLTKTGDTLNIVSADNTMTVNADSIQVKLNTSGGITVSGSGIGINLDTNPGLQLLANALSILLNGSTLSIGASGLSVNQAKFIFGEIPSGAMNSVNTTFTLANTPTTGTQSLYLNGQRLNAGAGNDYTISGLTITMASPPVSTDIILADYIIP